MEVIYVVNTIVVNSIWYNTPNDVNQYPNMNFQSLKSPKL